MMATYEVNGRQFVVLPVAQANGTFPARFDDPNAPPPAPGGRGGRGGPGGGVWHVPVRLDADAMHAAAQLALGKHDFTTYRAAECQAKSPVKTLDRLDVSRQLDLVIVSASARSFLHHQVRSLVGSLKLVGEGRWTPRDFRAALDARDRSRCGTLAPPDGLYLTRVEY
jgi:tRNA pseudouridine38-40 synthase